MNGSGAHRRQRVGALLWLTYLCAAAAPAAAACQTIWASLGAGVEHSRWTETSAQGRKLVSETGTLRGPSLAWGAQCVAFDAVVRWVRMGGNRAYEGISSVQVPVRTRTEIEQRGVEFQGFLPLDAHWSGAGRVGLRWIDREIASVGRTQGYPERFFNAELAAGARYAAAPEAPVQWTAIAWLGAGPPGRLELQLPGADPAKLRLGVSRSLALELQAQGEAGAHGWHWLARFTHRRDQWQAGEAQVITRQGVPVAGAAQPVTRQLTSGLQAELRIDF